jgi:hypothetical protein
MSSWRFIAAIVGLMLAWLAFVAVAAVFDPPPCDPHGALPWLRCEKDYHP